MIYIHIKYHAEYFHHPKNPCDLPIHPYPLPLTPNPQPLANIDLFSVSIVLLFPKCQVVGTMHYVAFSD